MDWHCAEWLKTMLNKPGLMLVSLLSFYIVRVIISIDDIFKGIVISRWITTNEIGLLVSLARKLFFPTHMSLIITFWKKKNIVETEAHFMNTFFPPQFNFNGQIVSLLTYWSYCSFALSHRYTGIEYDVDPYTYSSTDTCHRLNSFHGKTGITCGRMKLWWYNELDHNHGQLPLQ